MDAIQERLINPINGQPVDEIISETDARERGYFEFQFILRYLEDDNEFVKYYVVDGKRIIVDLDKPYLDYKNKTQINHARVIADKPVEACSLEDPECISCGS